MKIIKRGNLPELSTWWGTCHSCRSEVEAEKRELSVKSYGNETFGKAQCPSCGKIMNFYPKKQGE